MTRRGLRYRAGRPPHRAGGDGDAGFTLIELAASLTVLAVGIVGVIGVMNGSFRVAINASARSKAIAVATATIEEFRAMEYDKVTVPDPTDPILPDEQVKVDGREYFVAKTVTRTNEAAAPPPGDGRAAKANAYKHVLVVVRWPEGGGMKFIQQETLLYPGGRGSFDPVQVAEEVGNGSPLGPSGTITSTSLAASSGVQLEWEAAPPSSDPPVDTYVVRYSTDASFAAYQEVTDTVSSLSPTLMLTDLASGTYFFRVYSKATNGKLSTGYATGTSVVTAPASLGCSFGDAAATPPAVHRRNAFGHLDADIVVSVNGIGTPILGVHPCASKLLQARYTTLAGTTAVVPLTWTGTVFTGNAEGTHAPWAVGAHDLDVYEGTVRQASVNVVVCEKGKAACP